MAHIDTDDAFSILDCFQDLEDPRSTTNRRHLLGDLIVICVLAVVAGADGPTAIHYWAKGKEAWLCELLELPHGIPSRDTIRRLLSLLKPAAFQECFQGWIASIRANDEQDDKQGTQEIIAIDGKALRRSHDKRNGLGPLFLVSAWATQSGISLGQLATAEKSNEITAIPELLDQIDVGGAIVTIDAAGCQKAIAAKIHDNGGDFVLALKGNQGNMHRRVSDYINLHIKSDFANVPARKYEQVVKGHGRIDTLTYYQLPVPKWLKGQNDWKGLKTIGVAVRSSNSDAMTTRDVRLYLCSLRMGVKRFAVAVRGHWGIENTLHWCLDVTFREDESRVRDRQAANNLAWLKRCTITLLKQQSDKMSIAMRRRMAGWNLDYLAQVVGLNKG